NRHCPAGTRWDAFLQSSYFQPDASSRDDAQRSAASLSRRLYSGSGGLVMAPLTILYDPACGLCRRVHGWLADQPKFFELNLLPIKSDSARRRFPELNHDLTAEDLTVITNKG